VSKALTSAEREILNRVRSSHFGFLPLKKWLEMKSIKPLPNLLKRLYDQPGAPAKAAV